LHICSIQGLDCIIVTRTLTFEKVCLTTLHVLLVLPPPRGAARRRSILLLDHLLHLGIAPDAWISIYVCVRE
jgi:hypothetical protein